MAIFPLLSSQPHALSTTTRRTRLRRLSIHSNRSRRLIRLLLRATWILSLLWAEYLYFYHSIASCHWPNVPSSHTLDPFNILIIADPQIPSLNYSYPSRPYVLQILSIHIIDQFIRKAWRLVLRATMPDAIVFLGDLLDGGVTTTDPTQYQSYVHRFRRTFPIPNNIPSFVDEGRLIFLAGNHDLGLAPSTNPSDATLARERFVTNWPPGKLSGQTEWGNHTIIWIDAIGLIEEDKASMISPNNTKPVRNFINNLSGPPTLLPKILFTHVPLWRPEGTPCGPLRESQRAIRQGSGRNYQNEIPDKLSQFLQEKIQPSLVFSGDDHDYCDVVHTIPSTSYANPSPLSVHEVSVKSFSMGMGIQQPGYQLLSLYNPSKFSKIPGEETTFHRPCVLPNQIYIYTHLYLPLLVLTVLSIFGPLAWRRLMFGRGAIRPQAKTNGLPIHHRGRQHRKSLSRTLMFHKSSTSLSGDSASSSEEGRSDEEAGHRLVSQHSRRSGSVSFGVGPDHMENGGYNSPTSVLSYHSPVDSGHEDDRISHPFPASQFGTMSATPVDITTSARRAGGTKRPPPPTRYPSAGPSANTGGHRARLFGRWARDGCLMSCLRAVLERRTVERCEKVLSRSGWGRSGFSREICPSELRRACGDFGQVMSIVCLVYATIWLWFWW